MSLGSTTSSLSPLSNISIASPPAPPPAAITPRPQPSPIATAAAVAAATVTTCQRSDAPGKDKNRKKSKTKSQPKTRTIKFHEYKVSSLSIYCVNISATRTTVSFCVTCTNENSLRLHYPSIAALQNNTIRSFVSGGIDNKIEFITLENIMSSEWLLRLVTKDIKDGLRASKF